MKGCLEMRKIISTIIAVILLITGCVSSGLAAENLGMQKSYSLDDPELVSYIEDEVYTEIENEIKGSDYYIDDVSAVYISKEYLEELEYNSKTNVFYGYSIADLEEEFQGTKYVFTLGENNETTVQKLEEIQEDTFGEIIRNVAIGAGVILICVTISNVAVEGTGIHFIFTLASKGAINGAATSAVLSGVVKGAIEGYQTRDPKRALEASAIGAAKEFRVGAIIGAVSSGTIGIIALKVATGGGLTVKEAAKILEETHLPVKFVKQIHSMQEYEELCKIAENGGLALQQMAEICFETKYPLEIVKMFRSGEEGSIYFERAELVAKTVGGKLALVKDIDLEYKSELAGEMVTNLERMKQGYAAIDPLTEKAYQLHHIGQKVDSPLAILTEAEHTGGENNGILHDLSIGDGKGVHSLLGSKWNRQRQEFWKNLASMYE